MGIAGTDIAKEASDIMIMDDDFKSIVKAIKWGRSIFDNIRRFLQFQLSVNVCACVLVMIGASVAQESPLTGIQMLWVNMIMDSLGSLALSSETPTDELLNRPPNTKKEYIINRKMFKHIIGQAIYQLIVLFVILFYGNQFIYEYDTKFIDKSYLMKLCFPNIWIYNDGDLENKKMYVVSGMEAFFSNSTNMTNFPSSSCRDEFEGAINIKSAYTSFKSNFYASTHYTIIFNTFVIMQLFNELCCRVINDELNFFTRINLNYLFIFIWIIELGCQAIIVCLTGPVFNVSRGVILFL